MDIEADAIIRALFARNPDAAYRITMLAMALSDAQAKLQSARANGNKGWLAGLFGKKDEVGATTF
jgi:hypothetical protein